MWIQYIFAFGIGSAVTLAGVVFLPKLLDSIFSGKKKTYEIVFRLDFFELPSLYSSNIKGQLIKSAPITIRVGATSEKQALHILDDIIKEETKGELVRIKEISEKAQLGVTESKVKS